MRTTILALTAAQGAKPIAQATGPFDGRMIAREMCRLYGTSVVCVTRPVKATNRPLLTAYRWDDHNKRPAAYSPVGADALRGIVARDAPHTLEVLP